MVAYTLAALVGQLAHRRLSTDDDVTAAQVADFVVALVLDGLRRGARIGPGKGLANSERPDRVLSPFAQVIGLEAGKNLCTRVINA